MPENNQCPICLTNSKWEDLPDPQKPFPNNKVHCPRCGTFEVEGAFVHEFNPEKIIIKEEKRGLASGWMRETNYEVMNYSKIEGLNELPEISPRKKALKYLKNLSKEHKLAGQVLTIDTKHDPDLRCLSYAWVRDWDEHAYILKEILHKHEGYLSSQGHVKHSKTNHQVEGWTIAPKGWEALELPTNAESKQAFIAMSFNKNNPDLELVDKAICSAIESTGFEPVIMKRFEHNNRIDDEIIAQIKKSRFVVTDLTEQNQGAYFEAGIALGLDLPIVWTCERSEVTDKKVHFDTRQFRLTIWEKDKFDDFTKALVNRIEATIGRGDKI